MPTEMENLAATVMAKAAEFAADPAKGHAAGYFPDRSGVLRSKEIGYPSYASRARGPATAWLYAVATRDLVGWQWRVDEGMGGIDDLVVIGRLY